MILIILNMKRLVVLTKVLFFLIFFTQNALSEKISFFKEGIEFFEKKNFKESKFYFEKDIVFNPKNEKSYLFLAKISKINNNQDIEEKNLNSVLLLNPKNEEAIYLLTLLKIERSNYNEAKDLIEKFNLVCKSFCNKKSEIKKKFNKIISKSDEKKN